MDKDHESQLVELAKNSLKAFDELYEHYLPRIYGYIYNRLGNKELAEDLTSQTFIKAMSKLKSFEPRGISFGAWLYRIAHNNIIDYVRKNKKQIDMDIMEHDIQVEANQFDEAQKREKKSIIRKAMTHLHQDYQNIISLKFFEEMNNQEIANILGIKKSTLAVKLHRSLKALKKVLNSREYKYLLGIT